MESKNLDAIKKEIEKAVKDLTYVSETDSLFSLVCVQKETGVSIPRIVKKLSRSATGKVNKEQIASFFENLTTERSWHNEEKRKQTERYRKLQELLNNNLSDLMCYKIGRVKIEIFILGVYNDHILGVRTEAVET
ncbi:MAG: hypothetical protein KF685_00595 [Acidobacteria bacterium]|nr:hypothetical protein [Acidobacteriota bacterium]